MSADELRAKLREHDRELSALSVEWRRPTATAEERNGVWLRHRAVRAERRVIENRLAALGREQVLAPRDRYPRQGFNLSGASFPWDATEAMRMALAPRVDGVLRRVELAGCMVGQRR